MIWWVGVVVGRYVWTGVCACVGVYCASGSVYGGVSVLVCKRAEEVEVERGRW